MSEVRPAQPSPREEAKRIILGILQESGGRFSGRTRLYKAFYWAHLAHWREGEGVLTRYPIVRMPNGPGIDEGPFLLRELAGEGRISRKQNDVGGYAEDEYELLDKSRSWTTAGERQSIRAGLKEVELKNGKMVSDDSHERSRAWQEARDGAELCIYLDLVPAQDLAKMAEGMAKMEERVRNALGE